MTDTINIIDLFAGPGGLGEGFSAYERDGQNPFKIRMSVEREDSAHKTLTLRAFFRILKSSGDTGAYFDYVEGKRSKHQLIESFPDLWAQALEETLEKPTALGVDNERIHSRLKQLKQKHQGEPWIVIGGPPCQAYSLVGRARNKGIADYKAEEDGRHFLYQEYLHVLSIIEPDVFVMENVKGILSSSVSGEPIFPRILNDLKKPGFISEGRENCRNYQIFSFVKSPDFHTDSSLAYKNVQDFIIRAEDYGVPQTRHRVILLGVATDQNGFRPSRLKSADEVPIENILKGLPALRSKKSKGGDSSDLWREAIQENFRLVLEDTKNKRFYQPVINAMEQALKELKSESPVLASDYINDIELKDFSGPLDRWLLKDKPGIVLNHEARGHMDSDLGRYFFSACWALPEVYGMSEKPFPKVEDYPKSLAPAHANWESGKFADRFRVQRYGRPATTVTSHISKDGHYFIHPDPTQCRSLTVREAARIQTFPDNYFFEGNRTQQYVQVGNAVPPYLAVQLADIVCELFG